MSSDGYGSSYTGSGGNGGFGGGGVGAGGPGVRGDGLGGFGGGNGNGDSGGGAGLGGGIFVRSGSLTLSKTSFTKNTATGGTGYNSGTGGNSGLGLGGAIFIIQSLTNTNGNNQGMPTVLPTVTAVNNPTFSRNSAANDSGISTNNDNVYGTITPLNLTGTPNADVLTGTASNKGLPKNKSFQEK